MTGAGAGVVGAEAGAGGTVVGVGLPGGAGTGEVGDVVGAQTL